MKEKVILFLFVLFLLKKQFLSKNSCESILGFNHSRALQIGDKSSLQQIMIDKICDTMGPFTDMD